MSKLDERLTCLKSVTENGELLLETRDPSVRHKAEQAGNEVKSFSYWVRDSEEIVNGRVTSTRPGQPFGFTVLAEEAQLGP